MTQEEQDAPDKKAADDKVAAEAEFETSLEGLSDEEKDAKRKEHAAQSSDTELDAEIAAEEDKKKKAGEAFAKREADRKTREAAAGADDEDAKKPLTRADLAGIREEAAAEAMKVANAAQALFIARSLATSDKEAQLIVLKWQNRTFPTDMSLSDQIEEAYAITNRKKLIGERNEALRVARNKGNVNTNGAGTHRDSPAGGEPKISDADKTAIKAAGFEWDGAKRLYKKPLKGGKMFLYRDAKTGRTYTGA